MLPARRGWGNGFDVTETMMGAPRSAPISRPTRRRKALVTAAAVIGCYVLLAYGVLPWAWTHHEHQKGLEGRPMVTQTAQGIPGDPLNVGVVGSREDVVLAMH